MNHLYRATFYTTKGGFQCWIMNIEAASAKDARQKLVNLWNGDYNKGVRWDKIPHQFRIKVSRLKAGEEFLYHYFTKISKEEFWKYY